MPNDNELNLPPRRNTYSESYSESNALDRDIETLRARKARLLEEQEQIRSSLGQLVREGVRELEKRQQELRVSIEQLERRRDRIREEMRTSFAGVSQDLAVRVQGFKDYLIGSLQDLAAAAEQMELTPPQAPPVAPPPPAGAPARPRAAKDVPVGFSQQTFTKDMQLVRDRLEQYRTSPDYYGPPWQLRRTFEPIHVERVQQWFFKLGGRGAVRTMGSRLQNILLASAIISIAREIYRERLRVLILANTPERLGEWRRGLQDCLGISRSDFGPERGIVLFEESEAVAIKADRLQKQERIPLIVTDETSDKVDIALLQFPLWLAFALDPRALSAAGDDDNFF